MTGRQPWKRVDFQGSVSRELARELITLLDDECRIL
jgi:hypothetical protein